jgi:hypothetical protein
VGIQSARQRGIERHEDDRKTWEEQVRKRLNENCDEGIAVRLLLLLPLKMLVFFIFLVEIIHSIFCIISADGCWRNGCGSQDCPSIHS